MKFVMLGAGKIAQLFLNIHQRQFGRNLELVGIVATHEILAPFILADGTISTSNFLPLSMTDRQESALQELLLDTRPDFILSVQYPWILSSKILDLVGGRILNLHNARLPQFRGHNTISHEILNQEQVHTVTLHWMAKEVDRGSIVMTRDIAIKSEDTAYSLWLRSVDAAVALLSEFVSNWQSIVYEQEGNSVAIGGTYYPKAAIQALKCIPESASLEDIDRIARAFWFPPHEPAYFLKGNRRLYVLPDAYEYLNKVAHL
jgi:methionyl-tRNA formyltransferase